MTDRIRVCLSCDDLGMNESINQAALDLAERKMLGAASVLVDYGQDDFLSGLRKNYPTLDLGLHFTLTRGDAVPDYIKLMIKLLFRGFTSSEVKGELRAQLKKLHDVGVKPFFLDGHYHIHIFPCISPVVEKFSLENKLFVRVPYDISPFFSLKKSLYNYLCSSSVILPFFGVGLMGRKMTVKNVKKQIQYLKEHNIKRAIWMIHPGMGGHSDSDLIHKERRMEYDFLIREEAFLAESFEFVKMSSLVE